MPYNLLRRSGAFKRLTQNDTSGLKAEPREEKAMKVRGAVIGLLLLNALFARAQSTEDQVKPI